MEYMIPIVLFICIVYAIKIVVDARLRSKMIAGNLSDELVRSMVLMDEQQRRQASLRWGIVLISIGMGFAVLETFRWDHEGPGALAILLAATGLGNLASYWLTRNESQPASTGRPTV